MSQVLLSPVLPPCGSLQAAPAIVAWPVGQVKRASENFRSLKNIPPSHAASSFISCYWGKAANAGGAGTELPRTAAGDGAVRQKGGLSFPDPAEQAYCGWRGHPLDRPKLSHPNLRNFWFLRQQEGVERRLLMVKLYHHGRQLAVLVPGPTGSQEALGNVGPPPEAVVQNEPNSPSRAGRRAGANRAKQTQFRGRGPGDEG